MDDERHRLHGRGPQCSSAGGLHGPGQALRFGGSGGQRPAQQHHQRVHKSEVTGLCRGWCGVPRCAGAKAGGSAERGGGRAGASRSGLAASLRRALERAQPAAGAEQSPEEGLAGAGAGSGTAAGCSPPANAARIICSAIRVCTLYSGLEAAPSRKREGQHTPIQ